MAWQRRLLQAAVLPAGFVPVLAGGAGVLFGAGEDVSLDSHFRYLSGLLLGIGLAFWGMIPAIERHATIFRVLMGVVVVGGLGRLFGMIVHGLPSAGMTVALGMELVVTPVLCLAQAWVAGATPAEFGAAPQTRRPPARPRATGSEAAASVPGCAARSGPAPRDGRCGTASGPCA